VDALPRVYYFYLCFNQALHQVVVYSLESLQKGARITARFNQSWNEWYKTVYKLQDVNIVLNIWLTQVVILVKYGIPEGSWI
jgi:hypothetical protein